MRELYKSAVYKLFTAQVPNGSSGGQSAVKYRYFSPTDLHLKVKRVAG